MSLHGNLLFEQSHGGLEGDNASSAELYAICLRRPMSRCVKGCW